MNTTYEFLHYNYIIVVVIIIIIIIIIIPWLYCSSRVRNQITNQLLESAPLLSTLKDRPTKLLRTCGKDVSFPSRYLLLEIGIYHIVFFKVSVQSRENNFLEVMIKKVDIDIHNGA